MRIPCSGQYHSLALCADGSVVSYKITRNLTGSVRYQYANQESKGSTAGRFSDFEGHIATLGLNYALDPIEVW